MTAVAKGPHPFFSTLPGVWAAVLLLAAAAAPGDAGKVSKEKISFKGRERSYFLFIPAGIAPERRLSVLVTLHGSGQGAENYVSSWKEFAEKEMIAVVGPASNDSIHWASPEDGPLFLHEIIEQVAARHSIDGRRVYLFGHSAGAVFALQMAALESEYFAAAAAYAGSLDPKYFNLFDYAKRKIPYLFVIGTQDRFFPLDEVRATRDALKSRGFPVEYFEMPGQTHNYLRSAREINGRAWEFLRKNPLPSDPNYTVYWDPAR
ncbi:MAG TPA: dienelactone hydrolase family protein [Thermoanaerobaculia bacterium]|nr:dienelactone hydrolase family protein [Thermoanaerobaculia bacterium]